MKPWLSYSLPSDPKSLSLVNAVLQSLRDFSWPMSRIALRLMSAGEQVSEKQLSKFKREGSLHFRTFNRLIECMPQKIATAFAIHMMANLDLLEIFFSQSNDLQSQEPQRWQESEVLQRTVLPPTSRHFSLCSERGVILNSSLLRLWLWLHFQISQKSEHRITDIDLDASRIEVDGKSYWIPDQCYGKILREPDLSSPMSKAKESQPLPRERSRSR